MEQINFKQLKAVPDDVWEQFCNDVKPLIELAQKLQIPLCNKYGEVINQSDELFIYCDNSQSRAICFNGDVSQDSDYELFTLTQSATRKFQWCRTNQQPYDWLVRAILLVACNKYSQYWLINSYDDKAWLQVKADLSNYLGRDYFLPMGRK